MSFRALCPFCDVASRYSSDWSGQKLRCGNSLCRREFVPQFVIDEPAGTPQTRKETRSEPKKPEARWAVPVSASASTRAPIRFANPVAAPLAKPIHAIPCPRCGQAIDENTVLCLSCGTNLRTGRRYSGSKAWDKAREQAGLARGWLGVWSVFVPFGLVPYASEARLRRAPWAALGVVLLCFLVFPLSYTQWGQLHLFAWTGDPAVPRPIPEELPDGVRLPPPGRFAWYQLLTSQFLHGGVEHLIMNMIMLLVVGPKVNDLLGHGRFIVAYLLLGTIAGLAPFFLNWRGPPMAGVGASGSIMGIAGMYLVFSPQPRVRLAFWLRFFVFTKLLTEVFRVRGIWLVLVLFSLDLVAMTLGSSDHVGHDVHLTGFVMGSLAAAILVASRRVRCAGYDLLTWMFGQSDIDQDPDIPAEQGDAWSDLTNAPIIMFPFVAVMLFAMAAFLYRVMLVLQVK